MYLVFRIFDEGRYCCFVVHSKPVGGQMLKWPPLSLSSSLQKTLGESNAGLQGTGLAVGLESQLKSLPAHEIHAAIDAHHGTRSHIANQAIVLDRQVPRAVATHGLDC
jgi:hypothetical protein